MNLSKSLLHSIRGLILPYMESSNPKEYLLDSYKFSTTASLLDQIPLQTGFKIKLSNTIFHPQGGGQPNDTGRMTQGDRVFEIKSAETDKSDNNVWHIGEYKSEGTFDSNSPIELLVSEEHRRQNARVHSGGHLLDIAVQRLGYQLVPGKGHHFPEGAYVEYIGNVADKDKAVIELNSECEKVINEANEAVLSMILTPEEAGKLFEVPQYLAGERSIRFVKLTGEDKGCPCGGTHVKSVKEIGKIVVTKVQKKGKNLRVSYRIE